MNYFMLPGLAASCLKKEGMQGGAERRLISAMEPNAPSVVGMEAIRRHMNLTKILGRIIPS